MRRLAKDADAEEHHPGLAEHDGAIEGLGREQSIGGMAAQQRRQRAGAAAGLLLDHALQHDGAARLHACVKHGFQRVQIGDGARLHVEGAATVEPLLVTHADDLTAPRVVTPGL